MSFNYDVMTEEEAQKAREFQLLPEGIYDFAVVDSKFKYSSGGNPMIELKLRIIHDGKEVHVFDNLIGTRNMGWKTKHFCETVGLEKEYTAGQFDQRLCNGRRGTAAIGYVAARPKNDGTTNPDGTPSMWKAKNEVQDYMSDMSLTQQKAAAKANPFSPPPAKQNAQQPAPQPEPEPFLNDDIPF